MTSGPCPHVVKIGRQIARDAILFRAILNRIGRQGDMHIRIRGETFRRVLRANGNVNDCLDMECYREIDAVALETLINRGSW